MKEELLKRLIAFRDAVKKDGNTLEATRFLGEADEAVLQGALDQISDGYQNQLFDLITDIDSLKNMSDFNRRGFEATVDLIQNILYGKD